MLCVINLSECMIRACVCVVHTLVSYDIGQVPRYLRRTMGVTWVVAYTAALSLLHVQKHHHSFMHEHLSTCNGTPHHEVCRCAQMCGYQRSHAVLVSNWRGDEHDGTHQSTTAKPPWMGMRYQLQRTVIRRDAKKIDGC